MKPVPRLSQALRAFTNLSSPSACDDLHDVSCFLEVLRTRKKQEDNKYIRVTKNLWSLFKFNFSVLDYPGPCLLKS